MPTTLIKQLCGAFGYRITRIQPTHLTGSDLKGDLHILLGDQPSPVCFDIGANKGQTVEFLLDAFPSATIFAFEPGAKLFSELTGRFGSTSCVRMEDVALGAAEEEKDFILYGQEDGTLHSFLRMDRRPENPFNTVKESLQTRLTLTTLDSYCKKHTIETIDLLKIDTQGYDLEVLKGATELLAQKRIKLIYLEVNFVPMYVNQPSLDSICNFLQQFDYGILDFYEKNRQGPALRWCNVCFVNRDLPYHPGK
jgi:FkbM family methyltransferase